MTTSSKLPKSVKRINTKGDNKESKNKKPKTQPIKELGPLIPKDETKPLSAKIDYLDPELTKYKILISTLTEAKENETRHLIKKLLDLIQNESSLNLDTNDQNDLSSNLVSKKVTYVIKRLIDGLCSNSKMSRVNFSLCLISILRIHSNHICFDSIWKLSIKPMVGMKPEEHRNMVFGNLFAIQCFIQSAIIPKNHIMMVLKALLAHKSNKHYCHRLTNRIICDFIPSLDHHSLSTLLTEFDKLDNLYDDDLEVIYLCSKQTKSHDIKKLVSMDRIISALFNKRLYEQNKFAEFWNDFIADFIDPENTQDYIQSLRGEFSTMLHQIFQKKDRLISSKFIGTLFHFLAKTFNPTLLACVFDALESHQNQVDLDILIWTSSFSVKHQHYAQSSKMMDNIIDIIETVKSSNIQTGKILLMKITKILLAYFVRNNAYIDQLNSQDEKKSKLVVLYDILLATFDVDDLKLYINHMITMFSAIFVDPEVSIGKATKTLHCLGNNINHIINSNTLLFDGVKAWLKWLVMLSFPFELRESDSIKFTQDRKVKFDGDILDMIIPDIVIQCEMRALIISLIMDSRDQQINLFLLEIMLKFTDLELNYIDRYGNDLGLVVFSLYESLLDPEKDTILILSILFVHKKHCLDHSYLKDMGEYSTFELLPIEKLAIEITVNLTNFYFQPIQPDEMDYPYLTHSRISETKKIISILFPYFDLIFFEALLQILGSFLDIEVKVEISDEENLIEDTTPIEKPSNDELKNKNAIKQKEIESDGESLDDEAMLKMDFHLGNIMKLQTIRKKKSNNTTKPLLIKTWVSVLSSYLFYRIKLKDVSLENNLEYFVAAIEKFKNVESPQFILSWSNKLHKIASHIKLQMKTCDKDNVELMDKISTLAELVLDSPFNLKNILFSCITHFLSSSQDCKVDLCKTFYRAITKLQLSPINFEPYSEILLSKWTQLILKSYKLHKPQIISLKSLQEFDNYFRWFKAVFKSVKKQDLKLIKTCVDDFVSEIEPLINEVELKNSKLDWVANHLELIDMLTPHLTIEAPIFNPLKVEGFLKIERHQYLKDSFNSYREIY